MTRSTVQPSAVSLATSASRGCQSTLASKLLDLSRVEADKTLPSDPVDLDTAIDRVLAAFADVPGGDRLVVERLEEAPFSARIDPDDFALLLRNLVENALIHGDPGEPVEVLLASTTLEVVSGGPVLDTEDLARLARPFERGTGSRGAGLGLSIVEAAARAGGLAVRYASPPVGRSGGLSVKVSPVMATDLAGSARA